MQDVSAAKRLNPSSHIDFISPLYKTFNIPEIPWTKGAVFGSGAPPSIS
jgi:hypothetical protein